jgi:heptosyltransferase II
MRNILIIAPNWIGDAVTSQPLLASLKAEYPQAIIDVLASQWVAPIYRACEEVNRVIETNLEHKKLQWQMRNQLAQEIKAHNYQACFVLPNSFKSALIPWLANIPFRIGYRGELRFGLINLALDNPSKVDRPPMVEHYLALSQLLNEGAGSLLSKSIPKLTASAAANAAIEKKLEELSIDKKFVYVLCPGAEYGPSKRWPVDHFAKLSQELIAENQSNHVILLGSKGDHVLGTQIKSRVAIDSNVHNWCGETTLDEAIALIGMCKAVVSNDSGLMHIAAALNVPQVAIFGSSDPKHTPPLSNKAKVFWLNMPCSPCHKRECPLGHLLCLKDIEPQQVFATLKTLH